MAIFIEIIFFTDILKEKKALIIQAQL